MRAPGASREEAETPRSEKVRDPERVLSLLLSGLALASVLVAFFLLPAFLTGAVPSVDEVRTVSLADGFRREGATLPALTRAAFAFAEARTARRFAAVILAALVIGTEARATDRRLAGAIHAVVIAIATALGYAFLIGALLPMMPLG